MVTYSDEYPEGPDIGSCIVHQTMHSVYPTSHLVESISVATELWYKVLSIQSAKRLLKGEHSKDSRER
jgi:hypothetical protein